MKASDFFSAPQVPQGASAPLQALWYDARGEWEPAHLLVQEFSDGDGAWVHAYLHRKEGDSTNAAYWYSCAGRPVATGSLVAEAERIADELLSR